MPLHDGSVEESSGAGQERLIPYRIASTKSYSERAEKRVEAARQAVGRAREQLAKAVNLQEETMLEDGPKRLRQLLEEEIVMPSPFAPLSAPPVPGVVTEISQMQTIIDGLQDELAKLRGSSGVGLGANEDDPMMSDLPHATKFRWSVGGDGSKPLLALTSGAVSASGRDGS